MTLDQPPTAAQESSSGTACYHRTLGKFHVRILFIGDIFGQPGRTIVKDRLSALVKEHGIDLVLANGENAAAGFGITPPLAEDLFELGIDVITTGNHVWDKREIIDYMNSADGNDSPLARRVLRPANYPAGCPASACMRGAKAAFHTPSSICKAAFLWPRMTIPFRVADQLLKEIKAKVIFVDIHAEATSEKVSLGWYLDGRVTAVVGTHTHVPTADERVLPGGTAYITDVGMTGPYDSVIGVKKELIVGKFLSNMPTRFEAATGDVRLCAVVVDCDERTGRARQITRLMVA